MTTTKQHLNALGISHTIITVDGQEYCVTTGTGEFNYGSRMGGSAAFAYESDDESDEPVETWQDFCDTFDAIEDRDVAVMAARRGLRVTVAGPCTPVLTDEEFLAAHDTVIVRLDAENNAHTPNHGASRCPMK